MFFDCALRIKNTFWDEQEYESIHALEATVQQVGEPRRIEIERRTRSCPELSADSIVRERGGLDELPAQALELAASTL